MEAIISIKNLQKTFGRTAVLRGIDLEISPGQVLGYIGPNGAGKSTTVRILTGLDNQFEGEVIIKGINVKENPIAVKKLIGYIPEITEIYDVLTPIEYLKLIGRLHQMEDSLIETKANSLLGTFGLKDRLNSRMETFSKGMKQKVLIVSGLIHNPEIIFMDEPLTGLDANSVILLKDIISKLAEQGKTIFYCSHMMDVVEKVTDRIIVINHGKIIADGSFESLQREQGKSLESIFSNLTGTTYNHHQAEQFIDTIKGDANG